MLKSCPSPLCSEPSLLGCSYKPRKENVPVSYSQSELEPPSHGFWLWADTQVASGCWRCQSGRELPSTPGKTGRALLYLSYLHPEDTLMSNGRSSELLLRLPNQGAKLTE